MNIERKEFERWVASVTEKGLQTTAFDFAWEAWKERGKLTYEEDHPEDDGSGIGPMVKNELSKYDKRNYTRKT